MHGIKSPLPAGWSVKKLGDTLEYVQYGLSVPANAGGTYPMFRMNNFREGKVVNKDMTYVDLSDKEAAKFLLQPGDILFNRTNSAALVGKAGIFQLTGDFVFASYLIRLRVDRAVAYPEYINYVLNEASVKQHLGQLATPGVSQCNINPTTLQNKIVVPMPPLPEQKRIIDLLSTWDEAIHLQSLLLEDLRARQRALAQHLLLGDTRLPGLTDKWKSEKAGEVFQAVSVRNQAHEQLLSATQERGIIPRSMLEARVTMPEEVTGSYKLVEPGDFVISLRSFQGGLEYSEYRGLVSPAYIVLKPRVPIFDAFYQHYFKSIEFIKRLAVAIVGIRDGKQISFSDFAAIRIPHPALAEQHDIADVLNTGAAEIRLRQTELTDLREQKRGLMQQLLTGQVLLP